jgi:ATP-binding cassette subfamily B protein
LNNDVIGAQQAVTTTLGTVVSNVINLAVVLTIMLKLDWRLTLLTLIVLPAFIIPARRLGPRMQKLTRQGMQLNAEMNNLTVERFNVAGAMLAKLFGKRDEERNRFASRAAGVRDIGIRTAIYSRILFVALGLVAAVGTAVVYFVGGNLAISGTISTGTVIAFMMYVGQMYQPLAQLTNSRVDILTALVSFERVFEVLDFPASIADRARARVVPTPSGRPGLAPVAGDAGNAGRRRAERVDPPRRLDQGRAGRDGRARGSVRRGQDHHRDARAAHVRRVARIRAR